MCQTLPHSTDAAAPGPPIYRGHTQPWDANQYNFGSARTKALVSRRGIRNPSMMFAWNMNSMYPNSWPLSNSWSLEDCLYHDGHVPAADCGLHDGSQSSHVCTSPLHPIPASACLLINLPVFKRPRQPRRTTESKVLPSSCQLGGVGAAGAAAGAAAILAACIGAAASRAAASQTAASWATASQAAATQAAAGWAAAARADAGWAAASWAAGQAAAGVDGRCTPGDGCWTSCVSAGNTASSPWQAVSCSLSGCIHVARSADA